MQITIKLTAEEAEALETERRNNPENTESTEEFGARLFRHYVVRPIVERADEARSAALVAKLRAAPPEKRAAVDAAIEAVMATRG